MDVKIVLVVGVSRVCEVQVGDCACAADQKKGEEEFGERRGSEDLGVAGVHAPV